MFSDHYAEVNGIRLHYVGDGEGPLILFLHGFPEFWYAWRNQLTEFAKDHHAVALDMRGFNLSDKPDDVSQYRLDILVEDIRAFADYLARGRKFILVGHDWGLGLRHRASGRTREIGDHQLPASRRFSLAF
jgi:epoxide hydrolase 4